MPILLSLFDYTGNWAKPWKNAGWDVVQVDIKLGSDVMSSAIFKYDEVDVILAAPPCTDFSSSGAQYWKEKDLDGRTEFSVSLVKRTLQIVDFYKPRIWCLENPVGRLNKLVPELEQFGPWYFQPWWYGDPHTKKTGLWGVFNKDLPRNEVQPVTYTVAGKTGSYYWAKLGGKSERTKELRSATPEGFSTAFYRANKDYQE